MLSFIKQFIQQLFIAALLIFSLTACGGGARPFVAIDNATFAPARLAVISGETYDVGKNLALAVTEELQKRTKFQVLSQEEIAKKVGKYPVKIEMAHLPEASPSVWLPTEEAKKMKDIQAKLKVDYLFVVWGTNLNTWTVSSQNGSSTYYNMSVFGNLLQYPSGKAVAFTDFSRNRKVSFWEAIRFKKSSYFVESLIKQSAEYVVDYFIAVTKTGKGR
jgi:hypothetical protein